MNFVLDEILPHENPSTLSLIVWEVGMNHFDDYKDFRILRATQRPERLRTLALRSYLWTTKFNHRVNRNNQSLALRRPTTTTKNRGTSG